MTVGAGCAVHVGREGRGESSEAPARRPRGAGQHTRRPRRPRTTRQAARPLHTHLCISAMSLSCRCNFILKDAISC